MAARILKLPKARQVEAMTRSALGSSEAHQRFLFWHGASGRRYVHTVYSLLECPVLPAANFVLVRNGDHGQRQALRFGRLMHGAPSLNLAEIRRLGAELQADEVHVHLLANGEKDAQLIEFDLRAGQLELMTGEPSASCMLH